MKIGIDASYSIDRQPTGVGVYSRRLIESLASQAPTEEFTLCYRSNRYLRSWREPIARYCRRALLEGITLPGLARRLDVFHGLNQRLPERRFRRAVSTFHDLFVMTSEYSTPGSRNWPSTLPNARTASRPSRRLRPIRPRNCSGFLASGSWSCRMAWTPCRSFRRAS